MKKRLIFLPLSSWLIFVLFSISVNASPIEFASSETQTSLLELYTSEGCSSCPPAEAWLSKLKNSSQLWHNFVPIAFHVDYWNHLGWRDPWSSTTFSDRQRAYGQSWHNDSVYTPGFVLNGKEWSAWFRSKLIPASTAHPGILKVASTDLKNWNVSFSPTTPCAQSYEVHVALLGSGLISDVKAGENRGRRLEHDFVVLETVGATLRPASATFTGNFSLPSKTEAGSYSVGIWITRSGQLEPLQAIGGWISQLGNHRSE